VEGLRSFHPGLRAGRERDVEVGDPIKTYKVEPLDDPVPREEPVEAPVEEPAEVPADDPVPA
jgi:hypothetical protein